VDPALAAYLRKVAAALARALGPTLVGLYLHGSGALGGWSAERSDVDLLGVVARRLGRRAKQVAAARLLHPALACPAERGLELSLVAAAVTAAPPRRPPFELHVTTEPPVAGPLDGPGAVDPDLLLYFAVCRRSGVAVSGPPPAEVFAEPPRAWLLEQAARELRWALANRGFTYRVLTACRAWRLLEDGELCSKLAGGEWARRRVADPALVDAALAAQRGLAPVPDAAADLAAADRFAAAVLARFPEAAR
jgi:hypothetical protein